MFQLAKRFLIWLVCVAVVVVSAWYLNSWVRDNYDPTKSTAEKVLHSRLNPQTPEQSRLLSEALKKGQMSAVVAAYSQDSGDSWKGVETFVNQGLSRTQTVMHMALNAALRGDHPLDGDAAQQFWLSAGSLIQTMDRVDPDYAQSLLDNLKHLSTDEYRNVGRNPSYIQIASGIEPRYRGNFMQYQEQLTPLLANTEPKEWNRLMEDFQQALPRIAKIFVDDDMGHYYGYTYMLNLELVRELKRQGIEKKEAIEFVACNASTIRTVQSRDPQWAAKVKALQNEDGPKDEGQRVSLFQWACADPSHYWLLSKDPSPEHKNAILILKRYANTELPAILTKYGTSDTLIQNAIVALARYDQVGDKPGAVASFLNRYQDDVAFREELEKHGPRLVPAIGSGGEKALRQIRDNPKNIDRFVDADGKPKGKPWWTWVPGGSLVFVIREKSEGRDVSWGDYVSAGFDVVLIVAAPIMIGPKLAVAASKSALSKSTTAAFKAGATAATRRAAVAQTSWALLKSAGRAVVKTTVQVSKHLGTFASKHPILTVGSALGIYLYHLPEDRRKEVLDKIHEVTNDVINTTVEVGGGIVALPLKVPLDAFRRVAQQHPALWLVYWLFVIGLCLVVIAVPFMLLKVFCQPLHAFLMSMIGAALQPLVAFVRRLRKRPVPVKEKR
jgi:hypothetical protein